jgi:hypothetical protein
MLRDFAPRGIHFRAHINADFQAGLRMRVRHQLFDQLHAGANNALTRTCQVGKHAMCNRVVLGRVRRLVRASQFHTDVLHDLFEVRFAQVRACAIAPAPVTEPPQRISLDVSRLAIRLPPLADAITGACTGVMAGA